MKWMHEQEYESHRALLFLFFVSHVVVVCQAPAIVLNHSH
jgi:hypothetical protein